MSANAVEGYVVLSEVEPPEGLYEVPATALRADELVAVVGSGLVITEYKRWANGTVRVTAKAKPD